MPLSPGKNSLSPNIAELMATYKTKGKIGNIKPKNKAHALKIAIAIAEKQAKETAKR